MIQIDKRESQLIRETIKIIVIFLIATIISYFLFQPKVETKVLVIKQPSEIKYRTNSSTLIINNYYRLYRKDTIFKTSTYKWEILK